MPEFHNESPEAVEAKPRPEAVKPTLDAEERAEQQMEASLDLLEDALINASEHNPGLDIEGFYDNMMEVVYGGEFPVNKLEKVVDAIDHYSFSEAGTQKFNELAQQGDAVYLCELLTANMRGLELAGMTDLPKADMDAIQATVADLGELSVEVKHGPTYLGRMMYGTGGSEPLVVKVLYGKAGVTPKGASEKTGALKQVGDPDEKEWVEAAKAGEPVNPFGTASEEEGRMLDLAADVDEEREEFQEEVAAEYLAEHEKTGISPEEFMASRGMDLFGRSLEE